ncbi:MAG: methyltransferase domain-containing protein [Sphingomonadales bacterium]|nr:methyltransferase domain-containing protein [Sphingomonadales bacterium]
MMGANPRLTLKTRLKAWWEGYDPEDLGARLHGDAEAEDEPDSPPAEEAPAEDEDALVPDADLPDDPWNKEKIEIAQYIWGDGYCGPGGPEQIIAMSKLLALSPEMSMVEIGAGLGGPARTLVEEFGVWMTGYERSERLVIAGNVLSKMAGMAKKAILEPYDPESPEPFDRKFDRAFAKEALFTIDNKDQILANIYESLKPDCLFLITDYVAGEQISDGRKLADWVAGERIRPCLVDAEELAKAVTKAGFAIRVNEDISDQYIELISRAWAGADKVAQKLIHEPNGEGLVTTLLKEAEFWSRRTELLRSGDLRAWRLLAYKKDNTGKTMSDW